MPIPETTPSYAEMMRPAPFEQGEDVPAPNFARPEGTRRMLKDAIKVIEGVRETLYMPIGFKVLSEAIVAMMQGEIDRKDGP